MTMLANKNIQKLQRLIVEGLQDVKAQEIVVFNTEHLSALFERVVVASGSSNRQVKALSTRLREVLREAGWGQVRTEGEANGEWVIVDCGAVVVHIMQPSFRRYYNLEELWGEKPVRLKLGGSKPSSKAVQAGPKKTEKATPKPSAKGKATLRTKPHATIASAAAQPLPREKLASKLRPVNIQDARAKVGKKVAAQG